MKSVSKKLQVATTPLLKDCDMLDLSQITNNTFIFMDFFESKDMRWCGPNGDYNFVVRRIFNSHCCKQEL